MRFFQATPVVSRYESLSTYQQVFQGTSTLWHLQHDESANNESNKRTIPTTISILMDTIVNHDRNDRNPASRALRLEPEVKDRTFLLDALEVGYWPDEDDVDERCNLEEQLRSI
jgi:hypothetical protein